jgi:hypothetical protein
MFAGVHFKDRRYADDNPTLFSIDPYSDRQVPGGHKVLSQDPLHGGPVPQPQDKQPSLAAPATSSSDCVICANEYAQDPSLDIIQVIEGLQYLPDPHSVRILLCFITANKSEGRKGDTRRTKKETLQAL